MVSVDLCMKVILICGRKGGKTKRVNMWSA